MAVNLEDLKSWGATLLAGDPGRELITAGYVTIINGVTGERPIVEKTANYNEIKWRPGQAEKMEKYLTGLMSDVVKPKIAVPDRGPDKLFDMSEVKIDFKPVIKPIIIKKLLPAAVIYTALVAGTTWWLTKKRKR